MAFLTKGMKISIEDRREETYSVWLCEALYWNHG
jgi:hypothetical protein